jgi:uncharacterized damage-inducible protein DinB
MEISRIAPFIDYYRRLRHRTMAVVHLIPEEQLEWSPQPEAFSFGDVLRHLAAIERYVFAENAWRRPSRYPGHGRDLAEGYEAVLAYLERTHRETLAVLQPLTPDDLAARFESLMGSSIPVWKWLRALAEHEVHHRGQLYLMLRMINVATPPLYGLTSEEVQARSERFNGRA